MVDHGPITWHAAQAGDGVVQEHPAPRHGIESGAADVSVLRPAAFRGVPGKVAERGEDVRVDAGAEAVSEVDVGHGLGEVGGTSRPYLAHRTGSN